MFSNIEQFPTKSRLHASKMHPVVHREYDLVVKLFDLDLEGPMFEPQNWLCSLYSLVLPLVTQEIWYLVGQLKKHGNPVCGALYWVPTGP